MRTGATSASSPTSTGRSAQAVVDAGMSHTSCAGSVRRRRRRRDDGTERCPRPHPGIHGFGAAGAADSGRRPPIPGRADSAVRLRAEGVDQVEASERAPQESARRRRARVVRLTPAAEKADVKALSHGDHVGVAESATRTPSPRGGGTGSGDNAALLARLVGDKGTVVSIDIRHELTTRATSSMRSIGVANVRLATGDGYQGVPGASPYDRLMVTTGCGDVGPAWIEQLKPDGSALVPLNHGSVHHLVCIQKGGAAAIVGVTVIMDAEGTLAREGIWPSHISRRGTGRSFRPLWDGYDQAVTPSERHCD